MYFFKCIPEVYYPSRESLCFLFLKDSWENNSNNNNNTCNGNSNNNGNKKTHLNKGIMILSTAVNHLHPKRHLFLLAS